MAAVSTTTSTTPTVGAPITYPGWSREETTESRVQELMVSKFTEIVADYHQRKQRHERADLLRGPWYGNHYAAALQTGNQKARLAALVKQNAFFHGFPPLGFNHLANPHTVTKKAPATFQIKDDCDPTTALHYALNDRVSLIDCGTALQLAMYETLREVFGDNRFNSIFNKTLLLCPNTGSTPLKQFCEPAPGPAPRLGDMVHFANLPSYVTRHPNGESQGYNAVCISPNGTQEKRYIAFGTSAEGKTESEMYDLLVQEFNEQPVNPSLLFEKTLADRFIGEAQYLNAQYYQMTGVDLANHQATREEFNAAREQVPDRIGLLPSCTRLNIDAIKKNLA